MAEFRFKRGKKAPRFDARTLLFTRYAVSLPTPPAQVLWQTNVVVYPMDGNDSVGDCTVAGAAHLRDDWAYNVTPQLSEVFNEQACLADYYAMTGGPDTGLDLLTVLKQWQGAGLAYSGGTDTIAAYVALMTGSQLQAQQAVALFGGAYIGLQLPNFIVNAANPLEVAWVVPPGGAVGPNAPNPNEGHCVTIVGYDSEGAWIATWGAVIRMGWDFYAAYSDEAFAVLSRDWAGAGLAPSGFNYGQLQTDLALVEAAPPSPVVQAEGCLAKILAWLRDW